jgi:uncharacterized membrane protein
MLSFLASSPTGFFTSQVGDMLGEIRPAPAVLFYLLYVVGILRSLSVLKHWTWPVAAVDVVWGSLMTAVSATAGLAIADWLAPKA